MNNICEIKHSTNSIDTFNRSTYHSISHLALKTVVRTWGLCVYLIGVTWFGSTKSWTFLSWYYPLWFIFLFTIFRLNSPTSRSHCIDAKHVCCRFLQSYLLHTTCFCSILKESIFLNHKSFSHEKHTKCVTTLSLDKN